PTPCTSRACARQVTPICCVPTGATARQQEGWRPRFDRHHATTTHHEVTKHTTSSCTRKLPDFAFLRGVVMIRRVGSYGVFQNSVDSAFRRTGESPAEAGHYVLHGNGNCSTAPARNRPRVRRRREAAPSPPAFAAP